MPPKEYAIQHQYQTSSTNCSPTALSMLLSYYGSAPSPDEIGQIVPQCTDETGKKIGTINQQLATWCVGEGYTVELITFDCQVIDQSWSGLAAPAVRAKLELRKNGWVVPSLGKNWTKEYAAAYLDFLGAGGKLSIQPVVAAKLLYDLLEKGPFLPCVSYCTLYGAAKSIFVNSQKSQPDDINGKTTTHSIVVYGHDKNGNFLIADPYERPGLHSIEPDRLLAAISTAQIECDNLLFQISKPAA